MTSDVHFFWNFIFNPQSTLFFIRILDLSLSLNIFSVLSLRLLQTFLNMESVTTSENQRIIFKSVSMCYFIIKQNESGAEL